MAAEHKVLFHCLVPKILFCRLRKCAKDCVPERCGDAVGAGLLPEVVIQVKPLHRNPIW
jgi:hypothetical protein